MTERGEESHSPVELLRSVPLFGGLASDDGLIAALEEEVKKLKGIDVSVRRHADSIFAGAIGAALWAAFRHRKLAALGQLRPAS